MRKACSHGPPTADRRAGRRRFLHGNQSCARRLHFVAARRKSPRICFLATASGDNENYIVRFYRRFSSAACQPTHLELFRRSVDDLTAFACSQDILYVGEGNTANLLAVWRLHGFDLAVRSADAAGTVLAGISAGSLCWFESGVTDSFGPQLARLDGLGLLPGSNCPHYDSESQRPPMYHRFIRAGMPGGMAADDGVGLHFVNERCWKSCRPGRTRAYHVSRQGDEVLESVVVPEFLPDLGTGDFVTD